MHDMNLRVKSGLGGLLVVLVATLLVSGCVSSKEYKARLADIDGLKGEVLQLKQELSKKETENTALNDELEMLNDQVRRLADLEKKLVDENTDLKHMIEQNKVELTEEMLKVKAELREKEQRVKQLEEELSASNDEIIRLKAELDEMQRISREAIEARKKAVNELKGTYDSLVDELQEEIEKGRVAVTSLKDKLTLSMVDKILFDSGSAEVSKEGKKVLDRVGGILKKAHDKQIRIEGHTDNVKIGVSLRDKFPSNWELSSRRATNVVRYLQDKADINPEVLSATGYGEYRPVASNDTDEGKAKNRRIEIVLLPLDFKKVPVEEQQPAESVQEGQQSEDPQTEEGGN